MDSKTVHVGLADRSYDIFVETGSIDRLLAPIERALPLQTQQAAIITDSNVGPEYLQRVTQQLSTRFSDVVATKVPAGEASKSVASAEKLWAWMIDQKANRDTVVFALGGGVVGDLAGFIAATFGRGIDFVQLPTSLLAQVDSSVGGKVGINMRGGKNLVGSFWQPQTVVIDPTVLNTLPDRELRSGLAEVVKYGVIMDLDFFEQLELLAARLLAREPKALTDIITRCCALKADVVTEDETETSGLRAILNYGHTYGHAIEREFGYGTFTHGEAIAIGMNCAARMANLLGRVDDAMVDRQATLLQALELPIELPDPDPKMIERLIDAMQHDKKVANGQLNLILPSRLGHVDIVPAPDRELIKNSWVPNDAGKKLA